MARKQPYPRNSESARLNYDDPERDSSLGPDKIWGVTNNQNTDPVKDNMNPSRDGVGHDKPDPWRPG
jgi:hypothetical protein